MMRFYYLLTLVVLFIGFKRWYSLPVWLDLVVVINLMLAVMLTTVKLFEIRAHRINAQSQEPADD